MNGCWQMEQSSLVKTTLCILGHIVSLASAHKIPGVLPSKCTLEFLECPAVLRITVLVASVTLNCDS